MELLINQYATASYPHLEEVLGRPRRIIQCKANGMGLFRDKKKKRTREEYLAAKREGMAKSRQRDPERARRNQRNHHSIHKDRHNESMRQRHARRFFWSRSTKVKGISPKQLASLWKSQRGICALSGVKLDRTAQLDHIHPKCKKGTDELSNLQWVTSAVNYAKRDLMQEEFILLCNLVVNFTKHENSDG